MFSLTEDDLSRRILGCGDGPASFNAELTRRGGRIVSLDPLYTFDAKEIEGRIHATYAQVMDQLRKNADDYVWTHFRNPEDLGATRMSAMRAFLADYVAGRAAGRYVNGAVERMSFAEGEFDLALVSHFLFLYAAQLDRDFHVRAFLELMRVAAEVRVFPVLTLDGKPYPEMDYVLAKIKEHGYVTMLRKVPYEFQRDGNEMLVIRRP
jgi:hypothetical protein